MSPSTRWVERSTSTSFEFKASGLIQWHSVKICVVIDRLVWSELNVFKSRLSFILKINPCRRVSCRFLLRSEASTRDYFLLLINLLISFRRNAVSSDKNVSLDLINDDSVPVCSSFTSNTRRQKTIIRISSENLNVLMIVAQERHSLLVQSDINPPMS